MMIMGSRSPLEMNTDPLPFERKGERADWEHATPDYAPGPFGQIIEDSKWTYDPRPEYEPDLFDAHNRVLQSLRDRLIEDGHSHLLEWIRADGCPMTFIGVGTADEGEHAEKVVRRYTRMIARLLIEKLAD